MLIDFLLKLGILFFLHQFQISHVLFHAIDFLQWFEFRFDSIKLYGKENLITLIYQQEILEQYADNTDSRILIFVRVNRTADFLASLLSDTLMSSTSVYSDRRQSEREAAIGYFRSGRHRVLVTTFRFGRHSLPINGMTHVINYDLPLIAKDYIDSIRRASQVGINGRATTLVDPETDSNLETFQFIHPNC